MEEGDERNNIEIGGAKLILFSYSTGQKNCRPTMLHAWESALTILTLPLIMIMALKIKMSLIEMLKVTD